MICCDSFKGGKERNANRFGELSSSAIFMDLDNVSRRSLCNGYIDYYHGNTNLILCAPHGGRLKPGTIPDRDAGTVVNSNIVYNHSSPLHKDHDNLKVRSKSDSNTIQLTLLLAKEIHELIGKWPHVIVNQLYRGKMDANCDLNKAAFEVLEAEEAWYGFHQCIDEAKRAIGDCRGLYLDMHGQSHPEEWVELGYAVSEEQINSGEFEMSSTSIANLAKVKMVDDHSLISGEGSLGEFLEQEGYKTVPSGKNPRPYDGSYYTGGYNTIRHGSKNGGMIDAIQIECPAVVREPDNLKAFAKALAKALYNFWKSNYEHS